MDYWLRTIYSHTSQNSTNSISNNRLSPPILVVGTHRNNLSQDEVEQKRLVRDIHLFTIQQIYPQSKRFIHNPIDLIDLSTIQQIYHLKWSEIQLHLAFYQYPQSNEFNKKCFETHVLLHVVVSRYKSLHGNQISRMIVMNEMHQNIVIFSLNGYEQKQRFMKHIDRLRRSLMNYGHS